MEFAKYVGTATVRLMHETDWKAAGIENQPTVEWNAGNGYALPQSRFSEAAWAALATDPGIVFTGARPELSEVHEGAVAAAKARLIARQQGSVVLHKQDEVPAVGD